MDRQRQINGQVGKQAAERWVTNGWVDKYVKKKLKQYIL